MRRISYFLGQALRGMRRSPLIQLSAIGALAVALLLIGMAALGAINLDRLARHWGSGRDVTVFMRPETRAARVSALARLLAQRSEVATVRRVTPEDAYAHLKESLGADQRLLDGVSASVLPSSLEIRLKKVESKEAMAPLLALLRSASGVDEVEYLGRWSERLGSIVSVVRDGSLVIALIVALACLYVVAMTIRLGVFARRQEIEIQRLVGATPGFIRFPFLMEGLIQGVVASAIALFALHVLFARAAPALEGALGAVLSRLEIVFLAPGQ
ncbi:MAG: ABC transporter permease, partial [Deltaproteobacteria bacterium]|nr:ABC transporter permease [Deltaproteobacteria bacterium]